MISGIRHYHDLVLMYFVIMIISVRSPQWLRSKWWMLKRHVPGYQRLPFVEILTALKDQSLVAGGRLGPQLSLTGSVTGVEASTDKAPPATFRLCNSENGYRLTPTVQLPDGITIITYYMCM